MSESAAPSRLRWLRLAMAVVAVVGAAVLVWSVWDHTAWVAWMQRARPLPFFALMTVLPAVGVPVTPLFVLAGVTFGTRIGLIGSLVALGLNLTLCYFVARGLRRPMKKLMRRFRWELPNLAERDKGAVRFTLAVKFAPGVPAFVKHYGLGVAGVPFAIYLALSMLVTGGYAIALVVLGESMFDHQLDRSTFIAVGMVVVLLLVWWWFRRRKRRGSSMAAATPAAT